MEMCKRGVAGKGFGRRENLIGHLRRSHPGAIAEGVLEGGNKGRSGKSGREVGMGMGAGRDVGAAAELEGRLQGLLKERQELVGRLGNVDRNVDALRRTIGVLRGE